MRYRSRTKIKTKHDLIDGLLKLLTVISAWPEVSAINPGPIKPTRRRKGEPITLKVQYQTESGLKCLAQSQGIQEVFIVSSDPLAVIKKIKEDFPSDI